MRTYYQNPETGECWHVDDVDDVVVNHAETKNWHTDIWHKAHCYHCGRVTWHYGIYKPARSMGATLGDVR